jgi:hypothetical protein
MADDIQKQLEAIDAMFVQTAGGMTVGDGRVTLRGLTPATLFFSDRPQRVVGHLTSQQFIDEWDKGENSFAADPPNAVFSFLQTGDDAPEDAIAVINDPKLEGDALTYSVEVLEGSLPETATHVSLFIDPFGRPLSPVSAAGMHRRDRRRDRR